MTIEHTPFTNPADGAAEGGDRNGRGTSNGAYAYAWPRGVDKGAGRS